MPAFPPIQECPETCPCRAPVLRHDPLCACGLYPIGEGCPYCSSSVAFRAAPKERTRQQLREEADERMAAAAAKIAPVNPPRQLPEAVLAGSTAPKEESESWTENRQRESSAPSAAARTPNTSDTSGGDGERSTARSRRRRAPKAVKRTSEQVTRAAEQAERTRQGRAFWTELGTAVEGQQEHEDQWVASLRDAEQPGE